MNEISVNQSIPLSDAPPEVIEDLPVAYVEVNAAGVVVRANRAARGLYPEEHGEFAGKVLWEIVAIDEKEKSRAAFFEIMELGVNPPPVRRSMYTSAGEFRTFELHRSLMRDAGGHPAGIRMVSFDVTEAQIAHEETHHARQWLESVLGSIAEAVIVADGLGFVRTFNAAAEELLGWKAEEMTGKVIEKGMPVLAYASADQKSLTHRIALEKRTKGVATVLDRHRRQLRVEISTSPIVDKANGYTTGVVILLRELKEAGPYCPIRTTQSG